MIKKTLYFGNPSYLSVKKQQLCIQKDVGEDAQVITRPIEDIGIIILDHPQITITHNAIKALQENKSVILSCNDKHLPHSIFLPLVGHSEQTERFRRQLNASVPLKKRLWQQTVTAKIRNQIFVLKHVDQPVNRLEVLLRRVKSGDPENIEGQAAAYYWSCFLPDFVRDPDGPEPNGMLNYGYAIIRSMVARALVSSGMLLSVGLHHKNKYNPHCLADDIMEPLRPFIDMIVFDMFIVGGESSYLSKKVKQSLLKIGQVDGYFKSHQRPLLVGLSQTTASLYKCIEGTRRKIIYPRISAHA